MSKENRDYKTLAKYFSIPVERPKPKSKKPTEKSIERKLGKLMAYVHDIWVNAEYIDIVWANGYRDDERTYCTYYHNNYEWGFGKISIQNFYKELIETAKGLTFDPAGAYEYDDDERHLNAKPIEETT